LLAARSVTLRSAQGRRGGRQPLAYPSSTRSLLRSPFNPGYPSAGNRASLARLKRARPPHGSLWWVAPLHPRTQHMFRGSPLQRRPPQRAAWFYCHHSFLLSATSDAPSRKMRVATQAENSPRGLGVMPLGRHFEIADDKRPSGVGNRTYGLVAAHALNPWSRAMLLSLPSRGVVQRHRADTRRSRRTGTTRSTRRRSPGEVQYQYWRQAMYPS
jgi:hypothetical protein